MKLRTILFFIAVINLTSCKKLDWWKDHHPSFNENPRNFFETGSINIGEAGAAEISAFDPETKKLFVVNNSSTNKIDVVDLNNPSAPVYITSINIASFEGAVNSLDVKDGLLAAAIEAGTKQDAGKVVIYNTTDYSIVTQVTVGALPDMIIYSPDGKYILTANEGEPNSDYTNDPAGTVSIISVKHKYAVTTIGFSAFAAMQSELQSRGLRVFGPGASFAQDMEPEYITISDDSKIAWVTLQENNAIAKIDISSKTVTDIFPLGFKNYNIANNAIDASDRDDGIFLNMWPVKGMYQPDAIVVLEDKKVPYLFTANEGDVREYDAFEENERIGSLTLDAAIFPNAAALQEDEQLGRLNVTTTLGDTDGDGDYDELYSFGTRSFSIWNGNSGSLLYDAGNTLEQKVIDAEFYDDGRSDDKGVEPEGLALGCVNDVKLVFIALERSDAVAIYDVTNPLNPQLSQILRTGDAPEGVLFISAKDSPTGHSLLVVSAEGDGVIKIFMPTEL